jgi:DNA-binding CsgD family transcriptional regulator
MSSRAYARGRRHAVSQVAERRFALGDVVGRESELDRIRAHLDGWHPSAGLLLEGAGGIGKTTLWRAGIELARERGFLVLAARPSAAETPFSFAVLRDLLTKVAPEVLPELPAPQRRALEVALALASSDGPAVGEGLLGTALLSSVQLLAMRAPVLIAIDDVQWLDPPSAAVLQFATRRLTGDRIKLLIAARPGVEPQLLRLERDLAGELPRIEVCPLSLGALHRLVLFRLGEPLSRPILRRIHDVSGGNPFYALEIARFLMRGGATLRAGEPLPIPETLEELVHARLNRLPAPVRNMLEVAALIAEPTQATLAATVSDPEAAVIDIDSAVAEGVIEFDGDRLRFTHPLLAAGVVSALPPQRRRHLHARLARIVENPEERARHLAAGTEGRDTDVATSLEEAGRYAALRGAPSVAAELMELAAQRTPMAQQEERWRRLNEAGLRSAASGDVHHARRLLEPLVDEIPPGPLRSEVLLNLADCRWDDHAATVELAERALTEVGENDACRARIHMLLSSRAMEAGAGPALAEIRAAHEAAKRSGDQQLTLLSHVNRVQVEVFVGEMTPGLLEQALTAVGARDQEHARIPQFESPHFILGLALLGLARFGESRTLFEQARVDAVEEGVPFAAACAHELLAEVECRLGNLQRARLHAEEAAEHFQQLGMESQPDSLFATALVHAHLGNVDEARTAAERGAALAVEGGQGLWNLANRYVLGFLELSLDNARAAVTYLQPPQRSTVAGLWHVPISHDFLVTAIEALASAGDHDGARCLLDALEERAERMDSSWERATRARCRGLLRSAEGDREGAYSAFEEALHEQLEAPLDRARALLALGTVQRRANQKRAARASLEAAVTGFDELGARLWAERARGELTRIGGRAPAGDAVTPTERRVAELAAKGLSNKEIASALVVTVKAVEANLTRIYSKLGVRSRTELTRLLNQRDP